MFFQAQFFKGSENEAKAREYEKKALEIQNSIDQVLWNDEEGAWFDYDIGNKKQRKCEWRNRVTGRPGHG